MCGIHVDGELCDLVIIEGREICFGRSFLIQNPTQLYQTVRQTLVSCPNPRDTALKRIVLFQGANKLLSIPEGVWGGSMGQSDDLQPFTPDCEVMESVFDWPVALLTPLLQVKDFRNGDAGIGLNLLAPIHAKKVAQQKLKRKQLLMRMIPIAAVLLLLIANVKLFDEVESKKVRINELRLEGASTKTLQVKTKSLQKQYAALEDTLTLLTWSERHFPPLVKRLVQIANHIPASVRLTEIRTLSPPRGAKAYAAFDARRTLLLIGVASAQTEIDAFRVALVTQSEFSSVRQVKTEQILILGERWLEFTLSLTSEETFR